MRRENVGLTPGAVAVIEHKQKAFSTSVPRFLHLHLRHRED